MASAAALTLGVVTIPVYEIYKVGEDPRWLDGLDLLGTATGLRAAVIPHYDNAEGGNHDTRFCYMGERRLRTLERSLPEGAFILGVDSHTALVLDLVAGSATIAGLGGVTVRVDGRSTRFPAGTEIAIGALADVAHGLAAGESPDDVRDAAQATQAGAATGSRPAAPLRDEMTDLEGTFVAALERDDLREAVSALLDLDSAIAARVRAGEDSPDLDNASATFRSLIVRLGERAATGAADPHDAHGAARDRAAGAARHRARQPRLGRRRPDPRAAGLGWYRGARLAGGLDLGQWPEVQSTAPERCLARAGQRTTRPPG